MNDKRIDRQIPGKDVSSYTIEQTRWDSRDCRHCGGSGYAPIFNPNYDGRTIVEEFDGYSQTKKKLMRSNAYCICAAGRKIASLHQQSAKDVFIRTPDLYDVIANKHHAWIVDDPTYDPNAEIKVMDLPIEMQKLAARLRPPKLWEAPRDEGRERVNRMFDDEEEAV